jgi:hypothetical protein
VVREDRGFYEPGFEAIDVTQPSQRNPLSPERVALKTAAVVAEIDVHPHDVLRPERL